MASWEGRIQEAFLRAIYRLRGQISVAQIEELYSRGDVQGLIDLLQMNDAHLWEVREAIRGTVLAGGAAVADTLPPGVRGSFGFDGSHPRAEGLIQKQGADFVQTMFREQNEAVRTVVLDAMENNRNSRTTALDITGKMSRVTGRREGGIIGLTGQQADWVIAARRDLEMLDTGYFQRKLRDKRYDKLVRKAIDAGKPLAAADVDKITMRYKDKALAYRGQLIAQNEAHVAQAAGRFEAYQQLIERDDVEAVSVRWIHGFSRDFRPDHLRMNNEVRKLGEPFVMDDGAQMMHPHDPAGGIRHSAFCRCTAFYRAIPKRS